MQEKLITENKMTGIQVLDALVAIPSLILALRFMAQKIGNQISVPGAEIPTWASLAVTLSFCFYWLIRGIQVAVKTYSEHKTEVQRNRILKADTDAYIRGETQKKIGVYVTDKKKYSELSKLEDEYAKKREQILNKK